MRAIAVVLLSLSLSLGAATVAEAGEEKETETCPWKEGEVIKAEFVWSAWIQGGYDERTFFTPGGIGINIILDPGENCRETGGCETITPEGAIERAGSKRGDNNILGNSWLGRQMLITFKRLNWIDKIDENNILYGITASRVRLDPDPEAPRNTWLIPNQKLRGKIFCSDAMDNGNVYLITPEKKWYRLTPGWSFDIPSFLFFCNVRKTVTLTGDFLPREEKDLFQTRTHPEEFFPDW